jgi:DNA-binding transcriptional MocR family regulator
LLQYKQVSVAIQKYINGGGSVQISDGIERAFREGALAAGDKLPTVRALAERLGVSPATVSAAYKSLRFRGVLTSEGRNGTSVSAAPPIATPLLPELPKGVRNVFAGNPDRALLPDLGGVLRRLDGAPRLYDPRVKSARLLAIAAKRLERDGVASGHMALSSGALDGIERVLQVHLRPGDRVLVEDPGFVGVLDLVGALGLRAVPVAVDDAGLLPEALQSALASGAAALIVTPRAQNPLGAAIDADRQRALLKVLRQYPDVLVIEDDHAADVGGAALRTLTTATRKRWVYTRSVSKSLGPDLRLAVIAGDAETIARVEGRQFMGMRWVSHLLQEIVAALWSDNAVERQLGRAEKVYGERRRALIDALARRGIAAHGRTGMNVWIPVTDETATAQGLRDAGWAVAPGRRFRIASPPGVRVTVAALEPADAERFADALQALERPGMVIPVA